MDVSSLWQREVRRDFSAFERSSPAQTLSVARLLGRQNARLSIRAAPDPVVRRTSLLRAPNAGRRPVRQPVLLPAHKNQRCSCRWVFAYRTARRGFVFAASGTIGVAQRQSDWYARALVLSRRL